MKEQFACLLGCQGGNGDCHCCDIFRFTAPAGGDESQQAKDKGKEAADKSKEAADKAAGKGKEAADDAGQSFSAAARDVKDSIASGAGYVADRQGPATCLQVLQRPAACPVPCWVAALAVGIWPCRAAGCGA